MGRYNICVYAISKNEEKHVRLWMESMKEADQIVVLDTGSADQTVPLLRELGADVFEEKITPWRFDTARNRSLALVPDDVDICVCVDLDERFEPGWRDKLVAVWQPDTSRARYRYTWSFNPDGSEGCVFWIDKIHARKGFTWEHPVHEVLVYTGNTPYQIIDADGIQLNHYPDPTKSVHNISLCWNWPCRKSRTMTGICTISDGSICTGVNGANVSRRCCVTCKCPKQFGGTNDVPRCGIWRRLTSKWATLNRRAHGTIKVWEKRPTCESRTWTLQ